MKLYLEFVGDSKRIKSPDVEDSDGKKGEVKFCIESGGQLWWNQIRPDEANWDFVAIFACLSDARCLFWKIRRADLAAEAFRPYYVPGHVGTNALMQIRGKTGKILDRLTPFLEKEDVFVA